MIPKEKLTLLNSLIKSGEGDTQKLIAAVADALNEVYEILESYDETFDQMAEIVADVEESVYELEDEVFGDERQDAEDYGDFDADDIYDINCANCDKTITVDYDELDEGSVVCPDCGDLIEFTLEFEDED
jgi:Mg2+ and Co2+ transporter CorA